MSKKALHQPENSQDSFPAKINDNLTNIYFYLHYENQGNISHKSIRLLQLLEKREEVTVGDVAEFLHISPNTASENIKRLVKGGFVKKENSREDERKVFLHLTKTGKAIVLINTYYDEEKLTKISERLSEDQKQKITEGFSLLREACEQLFQNTTELL
jgi:DNA-binding MarR family transcriptional regulator